MAEESMSVMYTAPQQTTALDGELNCVVCGDVSDGPHFGVLSCRACAAFFRRTVSLKLEYTCRANGSCRIEKSARNMCRSCRYQTCLRQGMLITAVQQPRDGIGKHSTSTKYRKERPNSKKSSDSVTPKSSAEFGNMPYVEEGPHIVSKFSHMEICTGNTNGVDSVDSAYLCKMTEGYHHFLAIRRATQTLNETESSFKIFCNTGVPQMTNFDVAKRYCKVEAHILTHIVNDHFPPFNDLPVEDKVIAFKHFFSYFSSTDRAFKTYETFGQGEEYDDRILMHEGGYIKISELETFYANTVNCKADPTEAARIFRPAFSDIVNVLVEHMRRIRITEAEYITLLGMFLWNDTLAFTGPNTVQIAWKTREVIISNLYKNYQSLGIVGLDAVNKVSNLLLILPKIQRSVLAFKEDFDMAELFNIFEADECCRAFRVQ